MHKQLYTGEQYKGNDPLATVNVIMTELIKVRSKVDLRTILCRCTKLTKEKLHCIFVDKKASRILDEIDINIPHNEKSLFRKEVLDVTSNKTLDDGNYEQLFSLPDFHSVSYGLSLFCDKNSCFFRFSKTQDDFRHSPHIIKTLAPYIHTAFNNIHYLKNTSEKMILSRREKQIVEWIARGKTNKEIGIILQLSQFTVKNHIANIYAKLAVVNRAQAIDKVIRFDYLN